MRRCRNSFHCGDAGWGKGEKVALLTSDQISRNKPDEHVHKAETHPLMQPVALIQVKAMPKLGCGKSDFNRTRQIVLDQPESLFEAERYCVY